MRYGIHWFRRDLRIADNPALEWSRKQNEGRVVGIFVFDPKFLKRPDVGTRRFAFLIESLFQLRQEMKKNGGDLLVLDQGPDQAFQNLFSILIKEKKPLPATFSFNRDYEPYARERDARIEILLTEKYKIQTHTERDHLLIEPNELVKDRPETWYQVFSPFQKKWLKLLQTKEIKQRLIQNQTQPEPFSLHWNQVLPKALKPNFQDRLDAYQKTIVTKCDIELPKAGSQAAMEQLEHFRAYGLERYAKDRDYPAIDGTSQLSIYIKNGSISTSQIISRLGLTSANRESNTKFLSELIWREFYYHILYHAPRVETEAFQPKYKTIAWENDENLFQAWCEGKTGYPIVDAAMRQLNTTGWMHNRMRMVVASFLTKDLLIDWRWGERYFMQKLLDGDLAANNGGWQWAASTGCDPQPYFRIFNPTLQGKRYDPEGAYVRRFVPELAKVSTRHIHEPWKLPELPAGYPKRIVDHSSRSLKAISLFRRASTETGAKPKPAQAPKSKRPRT